MTTLRDLAIDIGRALLMYAAPALAVLAALALLEWLMSS